MTGQTIAEKIFSRHSGRRVFAGETVIAAVDLVMATDGSGPLAVDFFHKMGGCSVFDPAKVLMVFDHYVPCPNDKVAKLHDSMRQLRDKGLCRILELGEGICHQLLPERGYVLPGNLIVGGDSHSTTYGAFNSLGTGIGSSELAAAMISGKLWFRVPETIQIILNGSLPARVSAKDLALKIVGALGADGAIYKAIEFAGEGTAKLSMAERMTICNMMVETGAKCAIMPGDEQTAEYYGGRSFNFVAADNDAVYDQILSFSLDELSPMIAKPHQVDLVATISEVAGTPIHMGVLGTCTNGRVDDLAEALAVMGDQPLAPGFELLVIPASRQIYLTALQLKIIEKLVAKGAVILPPGCGPCCGSSPGIPSDGENILSTANRNFIGRMGNVKSNIYLGSPAAVAVAAVTGKITDPREII